MIEHIIITVLICFTVLVVNSQITSALTARWKRQADEQPTMKILRQKEQ